MFSECMDSLKPFYVSLTLRSPCSLSGLTLDSIVLDSIVLDSVDWDSVD